MAGAQDLKDMLCHKAHFHQLFELAIFPELPEPVTVTNFTLHN